MIMTYFRKIFVLILIAGSFACTRTRQFENFNSEQWKSDKGGCKGLRSAMISNLSSIKDELKGFSQKEVVDILGQPDQRELFERNQIYYTYFIDPGVNCEKTGENLKIFTIRFSAINRANELLIRSK